MNIAIVGAGVAGSYLACMLKHQHNIDLFEATRKENHWAVCAWGASKNMLWKFSKNAGLDFSKYILHVGEKLKIDLPNDKEEHLNLKGLVTYNKQKWEKDLTEGIDIKYGVDCNKDTFPFNKYDYIIDCTGLRRTFLPKSKEDFMIPSYEFLVENVEKETEFYVICYKGAKGYFWYFPLEKGKGFVGAGDIQRKYYGIKEFFENNPNAKVIRKIGRPIRLAPPKRMQPFYNKNIIGVGESIGCVFPMLGEGIIPSLICCDIFLEVFNNPNNKGFNYQEYSKKVLNRFEYYDDVYRVVRLKMAGNLNTLKHLKLLMSMYINMKREEQRFGFEINFDQMNRLVKAL